MGGDRHSSLRTKASESKRNSLAQNIEENNKQARQNIIKTDADLLASLKNGVYDEEEEHEYERDSSKWPLKAVELMTYHRLRLDAAFHSPKYTKNKLWDTISDHLKEGNFNFDGKECHLKFRNMLATYKKNVEKVNIYGKDCIKWKWFDTFHNVLNLNHNGNNESNQNVVAEENTRDEEPENDAEGEELQQDDDIAHGNSVSEKILETPEGEWRKWSRSAINLLLLLRHQFADIFNDPGAHKVKCWRKIAKILRESGYEISDRDCIVKWHNLINTYRSNLRKSGSENIRWEWFEFMSKILNNQEDYDKVPAVTIHSMPEVTLTESRDSPCVQVPNQTKDRNDPRRNDGHSSKAVLCNETIDLNDDKMSILSDNSSLLMDDSLSSDDMLSHNPTRTDRHMKKVKKYQRQYWKEKLKLQKMAEHRRKREWTERKHIEVQKINLKKQKLKIYHRLTKTLEKLASTGLLRDILVGSERRS